MLERCRTDTATTAGASLMRRRLLFAALVTTTIVALLWLAATALAPMTSVPGETILLAAFAMVLPWTVICFWNAVIGLLVMRCARDPVACVNPAAARAGDEPPRVSTAILLCIRNEAPERLTPNLSAMMGGLVAAGVADRFHVYVLSDSDVPAIAAEERARFRALAEEWHGRIGLTYRRRDHNAGFKAGNIRDFCGRWGHRHELAITLDADSFMSAEAILRLVRIMQADPKLGILQGLVIGLPTTSAFARVFQFGMRLGMRSYTIGSAWWQGDCGPYWGHNAALRLKPFAAHCELPVLPGNGPLDGFVLSHDQLEAVLMRRAGYEVRVLPEETLGWEQNPPTLIEFMRRDLRWCQGNMQYRRFLAMPGLRPVSRYQLVLAMLMFLGSPAWIALLVAGTLTTALAGDPTRILRAGPAESLFWLVLAMWFAPKIATLIDVLARPDLRHAYGGTMRLVGSTTAEIAFSVLLAPIMWLAHTRFLCGLMIGRRATGWHGQAREAHGVPWSVAARHLWPQTLLGTATLGALALTAPGAVPYASFVALGLALSIPFAVLTATAGFGRLLMRFGVGRLPEETGPPDVLHALELPAIGDAAARRPRPG